MKLSLKWLRQYVDIDLSPADLARRLTDATAEVESWEPVGGDWAPDKVRVAEVLEVGPHPNADRLSLVTVETGDGPQQVVCGAPNVAAGQRVAFATAGAKLIDGHSGKPAVLKLRPIRGVDSAGMVLSEKELGLSDEHEGILVLAADAPVGSPLVDVLGDTVFDVSTWANRADLLGVLGFAREIAAITGKPLREPNLTYPESGPPTAGFVDVGIEDPDLCHRFTASVVEDITLAPSPEWMQERLTRAGMRPINNVVDVTNYVMLETGQPLHAFDYELVRGKRIIARRARPGESLTTLDDVDRELDTEMLVICDGEGPVGIAGIMGGGNSEVSESTKTILLEVANFAPGSLRRTSNRLKLRTEASTRFEKGLDPDMAVYAQKRALNLLAELTGGRVASGLVDVYPTVHTRPTIRLTAERTERVLGISVPEADVTRILGSLGFECISAGEGALDVTPPFWRPDDLIPDDLIEDVGRIYGYDRLPTTYLRGALPPVEPAPAEALRERARDLAVTLGFQEIITYSLCALPDLEALVDPEDVERREPLAVLNPVAAQHTYLRTSLRPALLRAFAANSRHDNRALRLFEIGVEYLPVEADLPRERPVLCAVLGGNREGRWNRAGEDALDFFDAKGCAEALLDALGVEASFEPASTYGLLEGHTATMAAGNRPIGLVGQVHPDTAATFDIGLPVFLVELWLEEIVSALPERPAYESPSRFPAVRQDVALVIDAGTPAGRVLGIARSHRAGGIRIEAEIFDQYRGPGIPDGKKSLALALSFQADDRTLTDKDVARIQRGLLRRLEGEIGATLRGA